VISLAKFCQCFGFPAINREKDFPRDFDELQGG